MPEQIQNPVTVFLLPPPFCRQGTKDNLPIKVPVGVHGIMASCRGRLLVQDTEALIEERVAAKSCQYFSPEEQCAHESRVYRIRRQGIPPPRRSTRHIGKACDRVVS